MSMIVGTVCDHCGKSDIERTVGGTEIDYFPRNGWISINQWEGEVEGIAGEDMHVCSIKCLYELSAKLLEVPEDSGHSHPHPHPHPHN